LSIRNFVIQSGRNFTDNEVTLGARVVIMGPRAAEKLFGKASPIDREIKLNQLVYRSSAFTKAKVPRGS
jgi:putative ABC transport system permease protein